MCCLSVGEPGVWREHVSICNQQNLEININKNDQCRLFKVVLKETTRPKYVSFF